MIKYLRGSDIESDPTRYKARLYAIANELYILKTEFLGGTYSGGTTTQREKDIVRARQDSGLLEEDGSKKYNYEDEYALELGTESDDYTKLVSVHKVKEKDAIEKEYNPLGIRGLR